MSVIGRNCKYAEWITPEGLLRIEGWARDGLTDEQIAAKMGIGNGTFYRWQTEHKEFRESLKKGKAPVDQSVENALLKRALGYDYEETVTEIVNGENGSQRRLVKKQTRHVPPDTTAQIFWLKNRRPDRWRDKQDVAVTADPVRIVVDV